MCESSAHQERQEDHSLRSQRRLPQLYRGDFAFFKDAVLRVQWAVQMVSALDSTRRPDWFLLARAEYG